MQTNNKTSKSLPERIESILLQYRAELKQGLNELAGRGTPEEQAVKQINLLLAEVIDEVVGADIELRGDIDDKLLAFVPDMHQRSLEVTGVSSGFTNLYTRALVNQVLAQVRKQAKDMLGRSDDQN